MSLNNPIMMVKTIWTSDMSEMTALKKRSIENNYHSGPETSVQMYLMKATM